MTNEMLFYNAPVDIGEGTAMAETRDYHFLLTEEKKKPQVTETWESERSTTDDDDFTGWDSEIHSGLSQVPHFGTVVTHQNVWIKKRSKTKRDADVIKTVIPNPIPKTWARRIEPLWLGPTEEEELNTK